MILGVTSAFNVLVSLKAIPTTVARPVWIQTRRFSISFQLFKTQTIRMNGQVLVRSLAHSSLVHRIRVFFAFVQMQPNKPTMHRCVQVRPLRYNEPNRCRPIINIYEESDSPNAGNQTHGIYIQRYIATKSLYLIVRYVSTYFCLVSKLAASHQTPNPYLAFNRTQIRADLQTQVPRAAEVRLPAHGSRHAKRWTLELECGRRLARVSNTTHEHLDRQV